MTGQYRSLLLLLATAAILWGCASTPPAPGPQLPPPPPHPHGQALWGIVHGQCVPDQAANGVPAPCLRLSLTGGEAHGFALLKDRDGATQFLLMPTHLITGIEDPAVLAPDATNYFAQAWAARDAVDQRLGHALARDDASVAVNSPYGRSQDLLHLHIDCLRTDVRDALRADAARIGPDWSRGAVVLNGHGYRVLRIEGEQLDVNPFRRLADGLGVAPGEMGDWTLVLAGARLPDGRPGFYLLADRADPAHGDNGSGEDLQDHACAGR